MTAVTGTSRIRRARAVSIRKSSPLSKRTSQPAYTAATIMGVVHDALRRDLARLQSALGSAPPPDGDRRMAIADHARWLMDFPHHHHQAEDTACGRGSGSAHRRRKVFSTGCRPITLT
jgi:hypothetical protein